MFEGKSIRCAGMELEWAWYNLKKSIVESFPHCIVLSEPKEPEPCELREVKEDMQ
jgi:hypothetical protein